MMKRNCWPRIEAVVKYAGVSTNSFARTIGLTRAENLYQIKRGNNGISLDLATRIVERFPEIDKLWLLTGEGEMIAGCPQPGSDIPYYDTNLEEGLLHLDTTEAKHVFRLPTFFACDMAFLYTGRAMGSVIPAGSIVFLKKDALESMIPGIEYAIVTRNFVTLRTVRLGSTEGMLRLVPGDRENFDEMLLPVSDVVAVYKVRARMILNA